jgi:dihydrofolate reductase
MANVRAYASTPTALMTRFAESSLRGIRIDVALATDESSQVGGVHRGMSSILERTQRMATLVLKMSVSLDGYVAPPDGSSDWAAAGRSDDGARWTLETVSNARTHLIGAATYSSWASFWPGAAGPFAQPMNEIPKVVFSDSLASADWGPATIARGDLAAAVMRLKQERPDGYLLAQGGVRFARSLVQTGLIDEYRLVVHPVILGAGMPLTIEPVSTTAFSRGAVAHVFAAHP